MEEKPSPLGEELMPPQDSRVPGAKGSRKDLYVSSLDLMHLFKAKTAILSSQFNYFT